MWTRCTPLDSPLGAPLGSHSYLIMYYMDAQVIDWSQVWAIFGVPFFVGLGSSYEYITSKCCLYSSVYTDYYSELLSPWA